VYEWIAGESMKNKGKRAFIDTLRKGFACKEELKYT